MNAQALPWTETQVHIIPRHRSVAAKLRGRTRHHSRVRVTLHNFAATLQRGVVKCIREMADAPSDRWNQTALPQFASGDVAFCPRGASKLPPEAESLSGGNHHPM